MSLQKSVKERFFHALGFEVLAIAICAPLGAWWLDIGLWEAFVLDIGIVLFFMPSIFVFN